MSAGVNPNGIYKVVNLSGGASVIISGSCQRIYSQSGSGGGGGGATIAHTSNIIKGDNAGNGIDSGINASAVVTINGTGTGLTLSMGVSGVSDGGGGSMRICRRSTAPGVRAFWSLAVAGHGQWHFRIRRLIGGAKSFGYVFNSIDNRYGCDRADDGMAGELSGRLGCQWHRRPQFLADFTRPSLQPSAATVRDCSACRFTVWRFRPTRSCPTCKITTDGFGNSANENQTNCTQEICWSG